MLETVSACRAHFSFRAKATLFLGGPAHDSAGQRSRAWCFPTWGKTQQKTFRPELGGGARGWPQLSHVHQPQRLFLPHPAHSHPLPFKGVRSTVWSEAFLGPSLPPPIPSLMLPTADLLYSELPPSGCLPEDSSDTVECCQKRKKKKKECGGSVAA